MQYEEMFALAKKHVNKRRLNPYAKIGETACVIETLSGRIYIGINLSLKCCLGFCAEESCISQMILDNETCIKRMLTINVRDELMPPCGKCIEYITQLDIRNQEAEFYIEKNKTMRIKDAFLLDWKNASN